MGTNYYLLPKLPCPTCGHQPEGRHIGKSSAGWCFSLHVIPEDGINDLPDWQLLWSAPGARIEDGYGEAITPAQMTEIICNRSWQGHTAAPWDGYKRTPYGYKSWGEFHRSNDSERGPKGLLRYRIDGFHCIKHGAGTWDCIIGEFS